MHVPDGLMSGTVSFGAGALSAAAFALTRRAPPEPARPGPAPDRAPLVGVTAAFLFAAQMINVPVLPGVSGHLMGGALAATLLGAGEALLVMLVVLVVQCFAFGDGGVTALGVNVFNLGVVGAVVSAGLLRVTRRVLPATRAAFLASVGVVAWFSVVLAAAACAAQLMLSGHTESPGLLFGSLLGIHAVIGVGEALLTVGVVGAVLSARPELVQLAPELDGSSHNTGGETAESHVEEARS